MKITVLITYLDVDDIITEKNEFFFDCFGLLAGELVSNKESSSSLMGYCVKSFMFEFESLLDKEDNFD
ncbi:hypothetical protein BpHYR1_037367 [Brachionus plicatilis]|uniref:Uncharacterized protein n=1 Tax=Brachionus plicatilis TaxID=10195 RepID=A0A3M7STX2_BRAPC|nr:hypothetical protein BpHYR1_037367 [Brachionus plicatilis]